MAGNRIERVTVASQEENARLASIRPLPAQTQWGPGTWVPLVSALLVGGLTAVAGLFGAGEALTASAVVWALLRGAALAYARFFGPKT